MLIVVNSLFPAPSDCIPGTSNNRVILSEAKDLRFGINQCLFPELHAITYDPLITLLLLVSVLVHPDRRLLSDRGSHPHSRRRYLLPPEPGTDSSQVRAAWY